MASLSPQLSRSNSQSNLNSLDYQSSDDGYDYNMVDDGPEREPTRRNVSSLEILQRDTNAPRRSEERDHEFTETAPHIWQRHAGGRRAKLPDEEHGIVDDTTTNGIALAQLNPEVINIRLRWTMPDIEGRRQLALEAGKAELDGPEPGLQRRRVRWHHSNQKALQLKTLEKTVNGCHGSQRGLTRRLIQRVRTVAERDFVGGRFLNPTAIRYDNQDISRYTVDKTCIFFSFPYFNVAKPDFRKHFRKKEDQHPPRTLLQSHYRLNKTIDRDEYQCISMLRDVNATEQEKPEPEKRKRLVRRPKTTKDLVYVPQLWGVIAGLDTLITHGPIDDAMLRSSAMKIETKYTPRSDNYQLDLVRIRFTYQGRHEDLIWPIIQCDSWFGLLNKQQQILELLGTGKEKARPSEYRFWLGKEQITIGNWTSLLRASQSDEIVDIWMKKVLPKIHVQQPEEDNIRIPTRQPTFDGAGMDDPDTYKTIPIISAFLAWDILDEFGEADQISISTRVSRFLKAIYERVTTEAQLQIDDASQQQVRDYVSEQNDDLVSVLWNDFQLIFGFYVPEGPHFAPRPIEMYWGAVYEIIKTFAEKPFERSDLDQYSRLVAGIVSHARRLHQGVYCSRVVRDDTTREWHHEDKVAEGAILLAVMVDALGEILQMVVETVRCLRSVSPKLKDSVLFEHGKEACELLKAARDQLIREADGRDKNGNVGPVVTPEAITISLLERLSSGVLGCGTIDIINLYEECLEHLALKVEYEASRRLLKRMNIFQEEISIIKNVLNQQMSVLAGLRKSLDPKTFNTPSITRKLRHNFECKAIDKILIRIQEQAKNCDELLDRAKLIAIQNVQLVETFQDDNSKAIFVFTIVTVLFLPMGFVASFFGMNVIGINNEVTTLRHFWTISLSLTFGLIIPCTIAALKGEEVYFLVAHTKRALRRLWSGRKNEE